MSETQTRLIEKAARKNAVLCKHGSPDHGYEEDVKTFTAFAADLRKAENETLVERAEKAEAGETLHAYLLMVRHIETACKACGGSGVCAYGDTGTWHRGGMAGQVVTSDICDECWGTGDADRKGVDMKKLQALVAANAALKAEVKRLGAKCEAFDKGLSPCDSCAIADENEKLEIRVLALQEQGKWMEIATERTQAAYKLEIERDALREIVCWYENECDEDHNLDKPDDLQELYDVADAAREAEEQTP